MALSNILAWSNVWRNVKQLDKDKNGFIDKTDFQQLIQDYFPKQMEGNSLYLYCKQNESSFDKKLLNYLQIKQKINSEVTLKLKELKEMNMILKEQQ